MKLLEPLDFVKIKALDTTDTKGAMVTTQNKYMAVLAQEFDLPIS
jgi:hypothetical protein